MLVELHPEAERELGEAAAYLEERQDGLGGEFLAEATRVRESVGTAPESHGFVPEAPEARRAIFKRFKYQLVYVVEQNRVLVLAVAHMRRRPDYWRGRLPAP